MLVYGLKVACGAFSERAEWQFVARGQKAWLLPAKSRPVLKRERSPAGLKVACGASSERAE
jgi:hypothetical protein